MMLKLLYQIQKIETAEAAIIAEQKTSAEYQRLRRLRTEFSRQKKYFMQLRDELQALQEQITNLPVELAALEARIESEKVAIYDGSVTSLKELDARQMQLQALESKRLSLQENIGEKRAAYKRVSKEAQTLQTHMQEIQADFSTSQTAYELLCNRQQSDLDSLKAEKEALRSQVTESSWRWYEEQKPLFAGQPVAQLSEAQVCDGCRTLVTPMLYKRTVQGEQTRCEKCGRYLFVDFPS